MIVTPPAVVQYYAVFLHKILTADISNKLLDKTFCKYYHL